MTIDLFSELTEEEKYKAKRKGMRSARRLNRLTKIKNHFKKKKGSNSMVIHLCDCCGRQTDTTELFRLESENYSSLKSRNKYELCINCIKNVEDFIDTLKMLREKK